MEHIHKIFRFIDPPDTIALQQCVDAIDACFYPWEKCLPELEAESNGLVPVVWADSGQGNSGTYVGGSRNLITLNNRYSGVNYAFTMLHEAGHMVDDTALRDDQRKAILAKWHKDLDGRWDGYLQDGKEIVWSHNTPHTHTEWSFGWRVTGADYYHRPNEAFADAFVACFAPTYFPYKRFAHWSDDTAGVRDIILSTPAPPPPPKVYLFPNDQIYRLYRAVFLREPDRGGYDYWLSMLNSGKASITYIAELFTRSQEFANRYGSLTNTQFVTLLYRNVLERSPDAGGLKYWVDMLNGGKTRGDILRGFSDSQEFINKINNERKL